MILARDEIEKLLESGELKIEPLEKIQIQPASVDLRLGNEFLVYDSQEMDVKRPFRARKIVAQEFVVEPGSFVLATTREHISLPDFLTAFVEGRSSIGRTGLFIENAGWVDPGFEGNITLELFNANKNPIRIYAGMRICQIVLARLSGNARYSGKYLGQRGVTESRIFMDEDLPGGRQRKA